VNIIIICGVTLKNKLQLTKTTLKLSGILSQLRYEIQGVFEK